MSKYPKRPLKLWIVAGVSCVQAWYVVNLGAEIGYTAESADGAGGWGLLGVLIVVLGVVLFTAAVLLILGAGWARVPVAIVQGLVVAALLVLLAINGAMALLYSVGNGAIPVLMLFGLFSADVRGWFAEVARRRVARREVPELR